MIPTSSVIKKAAKASLKERWGGSIFSVSILIAIYFICSYIASLFSFTFGNIAATVFIYALEIFVFSPAALGLLRYFWRIVYNETDNPIAIFYYFSSLKIYWRSMSIIFTIAFKVFIFSLLLNIPIFILKALSHSVLYEFIGLSMPVWTVNLANVTVILKIIANIGLVFIMLKFYLAPMLFIADDNMDAAEAMHMSSIISKRSSVDFIYLGFSFFGWILLSVLVIPVIFTVPYILTSYLTHAKFAVTEYNDFASQSQKTYFPSFTA